MSLLKNFNFLSNLSAALIQNALRINLGMENSLGMAKEGINSTCLHEPVDAQRGQETFAPSHPHCSAQEFTSKKHPMGAKRAERDMELGKTPRIR